MAVRAKAETVPLQVYLQSVFEPDVEYVDGEIEERPAALWDHACWQGALLEYFHTKKLEWKIRVMPSQGNRI